MSTLYLEPQRHAYLEGSIGDEHHKLVVACLLDTFRLRENETIVEVGSGHGRYTELLLARGLQVLAVEPDAHMAQGLRKRFAGEERVRVIQSFPYDPAAFPADVSVVCGFHVLHHMDDDALRSLARVLGEIQAGRPVFRGWFFLEPNPLNLLYPMQIAMRTAMRFREEKGIWLNRYRRSLNAANPSTLGYIGLFPPNRVTKALPQAMQERATRLTRIPWPVRAYKVIGCLSRYAGGQADRSVLLDNRP